MAEGALPVNLGRIMEMKHKRKHLIYLAKLFTRKSDIVKLDASMCKDEAGDLSAATGGEVGQPQLLRVARLHLQALAQTLSQFLDHFSYVQRFSQLTPCQ